MAEVITDKQLAGVLRPFVLATTPMLAALRESDPLGIVRRVLPATHGSVAGLSSGDRQDAADLATVDGGLREKLLHGLEATLVPGTAAWRAMDVPARDDWWVNRVGRFTVLLASLPGIGGALADRLPIQDALGAAGQGVLLCALAAEHDLDDPDRVRLLASVIFQRTITREVASGAADGEHEAVQKLTAELDESEQRHGKITLKAAGATLWRLGRTLWAVQDELGKRPQGRFYHRMLGMVPVVGLLGDYLGERSALKRAAKAATKWMAAQR